MLKIQEVASEVLFLKNKIINILSGCLDGLYYNVCFAYLVLLPFRKF